MPPTVLVLLGASDVGPPTSPLAWLPYVVAFVSAIVVLRKMPSENAKTVGETMTLALERLEVENARQRTTIADRDERIVALEARVATVEGEVDELRHELRHREDRLAELVPDPLDDPPAPGGPRDG